MEKLSYREKKKNYRITIILTDDIIVEQYETQEGAIKTVTNIRDLCPNMFVGGAVEEKQKKWKVIWTTGQKKS
jgi:hypothetical protein